MIERLNVLGTFCYIWAGIVALFSLLPFIHVGLGLVALFAPESMVVESGELPPEWFGWIFIGVGSFLIVLGFTYAISAFLLGKYLKQHNHHTFCVVMSALTCFFMPIGTVLGVFALVTLLNDEGKALFKV